MCFFFQQKTAYELRISDWSSDVCSSDLRAHRGEVVVVLVGVRRGLRLGARMDAEGDLVTLGRPLDGHPRRDRLDPLVEALVEDVEHLVADLHAVAEEGVGVGGLEDEEIGRATGRERGCQYG